MAVLAPRFTAHALIVVLALLSSALGNGLNQELKLIPVATGLEQPLGVVHAGDGGRRLFLLEKTGRIRILTGSELLPEPFIDLSGTVSIVSEQGLLGLAFHPDFAENGRLFIHYTDSDGATVLAEYRVSSDPNRVDPASRRVLLRAAQPFPNHNGGQLSFGPDGYLYLGLGDGGQFNDPFDNGQNPGTLLGTILRLDVDCGDCDGAPYGVPASNPFVGISGLRPEVWVYGLRNPWRFSFDRATGDLYIADVGEGQFEEVDIVPAGSPGGQNFGWDAMEGMSCYQVENCDPDNYDLPAFQYGRDAFLGSSITGGYVYWGEDIPALRGQYLFGDFVFGFVMMASKDRDGNWMITKLLETGVAISSFGEDQTGELYLTAFGQGIVYRLGQEP